jgi:hypothetical protein
MDWLGILRGGRPEIERMSGYSYLMEEESILYSKLILI